MKTVPVIVNPTAGGGRLLRHRLELDGEAHRLGLELQWLMTDRPGAGEELSRQAAGMGSPLVLAWGGDGTYNEVARGLVGTTTAMGIMPGGTTSVLAYEFEVPRPAPRALEPLLRGQDRPMHVGRSDRGDLVLLMLSAGPDAIVVAEAFRRRRSNDGKAGIAIQAGRELWHRQSLPRLRVRADDVDLEGGWVIVGNSRCYAGPFRAAPEADPFAPGFEVVVLTRVGRRAAVSFGVGIALGRHAGRRDVVRQRASRVRIEPVENGVQLPYQVDGDPIMALPVTLEVDPRTLLMRIPDPAS